MDIAQCSHCDEDIMTTSHNPDLPLWTFSLKDRTLEDADLWCADCAQDKPYLLGLIDIETTIKVQHDTFTDVLFFSPSIQNNSPVEIPIICDQDSPFYDITVYPQTDPKSPVYKAELPTDNELVYLPPFTKNYYDLGWKYKQEDHLDYGVFEDLTTLNKPYTGAPLQIKLHLNAYSPLINAHLHSVYIKQLNSIDSLITSHMI